MFSVRSNQRSSSPPLHHHGSEEKKHGVGEMIQTTASEVRTSAAELTYISARWLTDLAVLVIFVFENILY